MEEAFAGHELIWGLIQLLYPIFSILFIIFILLKLKSMGLIPGKKTREHYEKVEKQNEKIIELLEKTLENNRPNKSSDPT